MGYKAIFLTKEDYPFLNEDECSCKVCERLNRNIIEPVVLFIDKNEDIENLSKERIRELLEENRNLHPDRLATCIFHCEKENEIWIENVEEYQEYKKRQKEAVEKKKPFEEKPPAIWRQKLVDTFWDRIRIYRFVVDYPQQTPQNFNDIENERESLILFYRQHLENDFIYDFSGFIFPQFVQSACIYRLYNEYKEIVFLNENFTLRIPFAFWFPNEYYRFQKKANFTGAKFLSGVFLPKVTFEKGVVFNKCFFQKEVNLFESKLKEFLDFKNCECYCSSYFENSVFGNNLSEQSASLVEFFYFLNFSKTQFFGNVNFSQTRFFCRETFFVETQFVGECTSFERSQFLSKAIFYKAQFIGETNFMGARFKNRVYFFFVGVNEQIDFSFIECDSESNIELINLITKRLIFNNVTNHAKEFLFFNLVLLSDNLSSSVIELFVTEKVVNRKIGFFKLILKAVLNFLKTLKKEDKSNLEIKNSILNKMRFINCDFSKGEKIKIEDSSITSCEFVNVKWGKITEERICPELFENEPSKAQDIYRQLKLAHDNQKDFIHGGDFYALEMRAYDKYLSKFNVFLKKPKDWFVFKISKIASNYAQDWLKPLKWILLIVFFLFQITEMDNFCCNNNLGYFQKCFYEFYDYLKLKWGVSYVVFVGIYLFVFSKLINIFEKLTKKIKILSFLSKKILKMCFAYFKWLLLIYLIFYLKEYYDLFVGNFKNIVLFLDKFFITLFKAIYPWKSVFQDNGKHIPLYKTFFGVSWIALSYLIYQLIVSLRRKIRR